MLKFFADTDMDISAKEAKELGINLISMPYTVNGKTVYPYVDFEEFDSHAFYDTLRNGDLPSTAAISTDEYISYFEPIFKNGDDILYIHFSAAMTMTFSNMNKAIDELHKTYPDRKVYTVDTMGISIISYAIMKEAYALYKEGKSGEEIVEHCEGEVQHFAMFFFADDLKFFRKSGRVSGLAATMGTLIGIRPIIYMSPEGKMVALGKEKGRAKAIDRLISYFNELGDDVKNHPIIVGHTDAPDVANEVVLYLKEKLGDDTEITVLPTNPTTGSHCGPNGVGICFHAIHR